MASLVESRRFSLHAPKLDATDLQRRGSRSVSPRIDRTIVPGGSITAARLEYVQFFHSSPELVNWYVQRPTLSDEISKQFRDDIVDKGAKVLLVWGMEGSGKTQLVLDYVLRCFKAYIATFWIAAGTVESLERDFVNLYRFLYGVQNEDRVSLESAVFWVKRWFSDKRGPWLIVFDGADAIENEDAKDYIDIDSLIPDVATLHVIITSRSSTAKGIIRSEGVKVGKMDMWQATELFNRCSGMSSDDQDGQAEVKSIVRELGYLALAITLAAKYVGVRRPQSNIKTYMHEYRKGKHELLQRKPKNFIHQYSDIVHTAWETSYQAVTREYPEASALLTMLSFLNFDDIFIELFDTNITTSATIWEGILLPRQAEGMYEIEGWLSILQRCSFLQIKNDQKSYAMHRLIHAWGYDRLTKDEQHKFSIATIELVMQAIDRCENSPEYKLRLVPHVMASLRRIFESDLGSSRVMKRILDQVRAIRDFLADIGRPGNIEDFDRFMLHKRRHIFGEAHLDTISAKSNLAFTLEGQGKLHEAMELRQDVVTSMLRIVDESHPDAFPAMDNLANAFAYLNKLGEAAEMKKEIAERLLSIFGEEHTSTMSALASLATTLEDLGKLDEATEIQKEVLEKRKRVLGEEHPDTITTMSKLANILYRQHNLSEAIEIQRLVLEKRIHMLGEEHTDTISAMNSLAVTLGDFDHVPEAIELLEEAARLMERTHGEEYPLMKIVVGNLARLSTTKSTSGVRLSEMGTDANAKSAASKADRLELTSKDSVIVVLGPTGAGKSHFIRAATEGLSIKIGASMESVTDRITAYRTNIRGQSVVLVDTIGFDNTDQSDTDALQDIAMWLAESYVKKIHLAKVLYMHDITNYRLHRSGRINLLMLRGLVGETSLSDVILLTNRWESVDRRTGENILSKLTSSVNMWGAMIQRGSAVERFSGTAQDAHRILGSIVKNKRRVVLDIQKELIDRHLDLSETAAVKVILEEIRIRYMDQMKTLTQAMGNAQKSKNLKVYEAMARRREHLEESMKRQQDNIFKFKSQNSKLEELRLMQKEESRRHENELRSIKDLLIHLEKQSGAPPPPYTESKVQRVIRDQANSGGMISAAALKKPDYVRNVLNVLWEVSQKLLRPQLRAGYKRLEWKCACGKHLYGDFKEVTPGSLNELAAKLSEHSGQGSQQGPPKAVQGSVKSYSRPPNSRIGWRMPSGSGKNDSNGLVVQATPRSHATSNTQQRQSLQLCIETGRFTLELGEIDLGPPYSDGLLFSRIRQKYELVRHSIFPMHLRFRKPHRAVFIKFRLAKRPYVSAMSGTIDTPSIPPKEEVNAGNYRYNPCPMDEPPIDSRTFLHHFYASETDHPDLMWGSRLPWKLGPSLGPMDKGWGILLEERPDWPLFAALMFPFVLLSGLVAGIYSWKTGDNQTGVAIGAWLTTVQTLGMTAVFFWWT